MTRLAELLEDAVGVREPSFDVEDLHRRARRRRTHRRMQFAITTAGVIALVVGGVAWATHSETPATKRIKTVATPEPQPASRAVFSQKTGTTLLLDDGYDGIVAVDLDRGTVTRRTIEGQRAGDQPYRLMRAGNSLVVGWGKVWGAPLSGEKPHKLGDATIAIPAAEPGRVWLVNYPGQGPNINRLVTLTGHVVTEAAGAVAQNAFPQIGVPGGIAYQTDNGIEVWNAATGRIGDPLAPKGATVIAARADLLAWCDATCSTVHVTTVSVGRDIAVSLPRAAGPTMARFSPDGRSLAIAVHNSVVVADTTSGGATTLFDGQGLGDYISVGWSVDSAQLFVISNNKLGRYDVSDRTRELVDSSLELGGHPFVSATNNEASAFTKAPRALPTDCTAPPVARPRAFERACTFDITR
ncbi:MAG: hypothetical protein QOI55_816 [Actinomycetota bacterium]|nr:hypothetical protein [Actinomycetota bacterium]